MTIDRELDQKLQDAKVEHHKKLKDQAKLLGDQDNSNMGMQKLIQFLTLDQGESKMQALRMGEKLVDLASQIKVQRKNDEQLYDLTAHLDIDASLNRRLEDILTQTGGQNKILKAHKEAGNSVFLGAFKRLFSYDKELKQAISIKKHEYLSKFK